jgi:hypothetical protein
MAQLAQWHAFLFFVFGNNSSSHLLNSEIHCNLGRVTVYERLMQAVRIRAHEENTKQHQRMNHT